MTVWGEGFLRRLRDIALALGIVAAVVAGGAPASAGERATRAQAVIAGLSGQAKAILSQPDKPLASRESHLAAIIGRNFHFTLIAELVIGPEWETLPQERRQEFLELFRDFFLQAYGSQLGGYPGDEFTVLSVEEKGSRDAYVHSRLIRPQREAVEIDWRLREILGTPLIIDIIINGTSVALSHREAFYPVLRREGIGGLITLFKIRAERLNTDTQSFAAGKALFEQGRFTEALALWQDLAEKGNPAAQFGLSVLYEEGRGVDPDSVKAEFWNNKAVAAGYPPALHNHALRLLADRKYTPAMAALETAARDGFAPSQYTLGKMYIYGIGTEENPERAVENIRLAAGAGMAAAQYNLGKIYRDGYGTAVDMAASFTWFEKAARQGHGKALGKLAARYSEGEGVAKNDIEALKWALLAVKEGDDEAERWETLLKSRMSASDIARAETLAREFKPERE
ncbi:hypothetical protein GQF03_00865 [Sneathiella chungangensis]|uniref:Sel1 repeat family protein n=1 Tax=Sneathiella chungangensis TaxID=1418234 RepID=A0A845M7Q2_9PROT|nr:hypothetical protein [Sneathiella chungangensis]